MFPNTDFVLNKRRMEMSKTFMPSSNPCEHNSQRCSKSLSYVRQPGLKWKHMNHNGTGVFIENSQLPKGRQYYKIGFRQVRY